MPPLKLLVVEDDPMIAEDLQRGLSVMGHDVVLAHHGAGAVSACMTCDFDAMVLDRMLPDMTGIALIAELTRRGRRFPTLMLSALGAVRDRIEGLHAGADDYLTKPFDMEELAARLHAIIRRQDLPRAITLDVVEASEAVVGRLRLEAASHRVFFEDRFQDLNRKQYSLLAYFMHHCDRVVTRGMLLENVWNYSFEPSTNIVESNVSRLRSRLEKLGCDPIETLRGAGYRFNAARCE